MPDTNGAHLAKCYVLLSDDTDTAFGSPKLLVNDEVLYCSR